MDLQMLDYDAAHKYVDNSGPDVWWDNYDIIVWTYNPQGIFKKYGLRKKNGKWGTARRIKPNRMGLWKVDVSK